MPILFPFPEAKSGFLCNDPEVAAFHTQPAAITSALVDLQTLVFLFDNGFPGAYFKACHTIPA